MGRSHHDRGQVLPLVALAVVAAGLAVLLLVRVGGAAADRARARTAADAAALAGVAGGRAEAEVAARENGGSLEAFVGAAPEVEVTVRVHDERATARARIDVGPP